MTESLQVIDWISVTLLLVFAITGFFNGFIKEVFSAMAWILSLITAWLYGPLIFPYVNTYLDSESAKNIISFIILFVLSFLILWLGCQAYENFQQRIPYGDAVPHPCYPGCYWAAVGHQDEMGTGEAKKYDTFGEHFKSVGLVSTYW